MDLHKAPGYGFGALGFRIWDFLLRCCLGCKCRRNAKISCFSPASCADVCDVQALQVDGETQVIFR